MNWQEVSGNWIYIPSRPKAIVHFIGGAFIGAAPHLTYRSLLEDTSQQGYGIIATPFINKFDHVEIARNVLESFEWCVEQLQMAGKLPDRYLPIYGLGHSMGCKLHLLIGSLFPVERAGNILISFNNFPARRAIPFAENLPDDFEFDFTPNPTQTNEIIAAKYQVRRNLLIKFKQDELDQTPRLSSILEQRFSNLTALKMLPGNHLTPLSQNVKWKVGKEFTPIDAIAQWVKQEINREPEQLKQEIFRWLNPLGVSRRS